MAIHGAAACATRCAQRHDAAPATALVALRARDAEDASAAGAGAGLAGGDGAGGGGGFGASRSEEHRGRADLAGDTLGARRDRLAL